MFKQQGTAAQEFLVAADATAKEGAAFWARGADGQDNVVGGSPMERKLTVLSRNGEYAQAHGAALPPDWSPPPTTVAEDAGNFAYDAVTSFSENIVGLVGKKGEIDFDRTVNNAIKRIKADTESLDNVVGARAQLSTRELSVLSASTLAAVAAPFALELELAKLITPCAAFGCALVGLWAEYVGKTANCNSKEMVKLAEQTAMEAEALVAAALRAKTILPLCVGVSVTASSFALLAPTLLENFGEDMNIQASTEFFLVMPLISVLGAAIAGLAFQDVQSLCNRAIGTGTRRFAKSNSVGEKWISATELVMAESDTNTKKLWYFATSTLPAPLFAALCPASLPVKAVVAATAAAAQAAYYLNDAEYELARAEDAVALKVRAKAVANTYATQGYRSAAILPYTSALGGLAVPVSAALVEVVPLVHASPFLLALVFGAFPTAAAAVAGAASISKARCQVNAAASKTAADNFAHSSLKATDRSQKGSLDPIASVFNLIKLTVNSTLQAARRGVKKPLNALRRFIDGVFGGGDDGKVQYYP